MIIYTAEHEGCAGHLSSLLGPALSLEKAKELCEDRDRDTGRPARPGGPQPWLRWTERDDVWHAGGYGGTDYYVTKWEMDS